VAQSRHLIRKADNQIYPTARAFADFLAESEADFDALYDAFLFHEHYVWNSARARTAYGTLELRPACQQPWSEHMAAAALGVGLIEAHVPIGEYVAATLGGEYWPIMAGWHRQVIRNGLAAAQPAPGFLGQVLNLANQGLARRGHGEEQLLAPLYTRLERMENPAQRARRVFATDGMAGLLSLTMIRPGQVNKR
jgi:gamma-glutamylcysteine synthetase